MDPLASRIACYVRDLCRHPDRHPRRPGNRAATELFARVAAGAGLAIDVTELDCLDWAPGKALLTAGAERFPLHCGPYSNPFDGEATLTAAGTIDELEAGSYAGSILLVHGELAREQLTPKGFTYYELPEHRRIVAALEAARPAAIVAATGRNPALAGSPYPFPFLEDADVAIPNAYLTDVDGGRLLQLTGERATLRIESPRIAAQAQHVVARAAGRGDGRIVVFGHVDTKWGTPGALDNATGAAALLGLAERLAGYDGALTVELVPVNGEDYYASSGEKRWERDNEGRWDDIVLGLNADAPGWRDHGTWVSPFCDGPILEGVRAAVERRDGFFLGEPWYQSDHGLFLLHGRPAVAVTSEDAEELLATVCHGPDDVPELVDPEAVADVTRFYLDVIGSLNAHAMA